MMTKPHPLISTPRFIGGQRYGRMESRGMEGWRAEVWKDGEQRYERMESRGMKGWVYRRKII